MGMEGILKRRISILRGYQDRWFILTEDGFMRQHEKKPSHATQKAKWQMNIILADIEKKKDGKCFNLTSNEGQRIKLKAQSDDEREKWIKCFKKINHKIFPHSFPDFVDDEDEDDVFTNNSNHKAKEVDPEPKPTSRISFGETFKSKDAFPNQNNDHRKSEETVNEPPRESAADITKKFKEMTIVDRKKRHLMVAAIDFGSAYSGSAYSFKDRFIKDPLEINVMGIGQKGLESLKVPTVLLLNPDREFVAFGFEAESKYSELLQNDPDEAQTWYYFSRFKMQLYNNMNLKKSMTIKDITGKKEMKAVDVFAYCIENIKDSIFGKAKEKVTDLQEYDVHWVLTVPAIWNEAARQFMLEAAEKAGIDQERLTLALEPEAAALCCKCLEIQKRTTGKGSKLGSFDTGARFLVVDLGGGTVDITSNEVLASGQLMEIHSASGGPWGGNTINEGIWKLLRDVFGESTVTKFIAENRDDYLELARTVELKKRTVTSNNKVTIEIPRSLMIEAKKSNPGIIAEEFKDQVKLVTNKLQVLPGVLPQIFKEGIDTVSKYVQDLLDQPATKGVSTILLVGGYAACDLLKDAMKTKFSNLTVICPLDPDVVVLKGAVIMGHMETPIVGRIAKCHYGIAILVGVDKQNMYQCFDRSFKPLTSTEEEFHTIIKKGQPIHVNEVVTEYDFPITFEQDEAFIRIYASDDTKPPKVISKNNCREIGHIRIKLPKFRRETRLKIGISNSETEFKVVARDEHTGKCFAGVCRFLN